MRSLLIATVAALALAGTAQATPIKRLAWVKVSAQLTAQAKVKGYATSCSDWPGFGSLTCTFYDPAPDTTGSTYVRGERHHVYGRILMMRYDVPVSGVGPASPGCTYLFRVNDDRGGLIVNICRSGWLRLVPRVP